MEYITEDQCAAYQEKLIWQSDYMLDEISDDPADADITCSLWEKPNPEDSDTLIFFEFFYFPDDRIGLEIYTEDGQ